MDLNPIEIFVAAIFTNSIEAYCRVHGRWHSVNIIVICNRFNWKLNMAVDAMQKQNWKLVLCSDAGIAKAKALQRKEHETLSATLWLSRCLIASKKTNDDDYVKWHHSSRRWYYFETLWCTYYMVSFHAEMEHLSFIFRLYFVLLVVVAAIFVHFKNNSHALCLTRHKK